MLHKAVEWLAVIYILVTIGALVASGPLAWRMLTSGEEPELQVLGWVALLTILSLPIGLILLYLRSEDKNEEEVRKWIPDQYLSG